MAETYKYINQGFLIEGKALLLNSSESYDLTDCITDVMIKNAYIENIFQLVVVDMRITESLRDTLRDNDFNLYLKIYSYNISDSDTTEASDSSEVATTEIVFDDIIRVYDKPFTTSAKKVEEESSENDSSQEKQSIPFTYYRASGIPEKDISRNETTINNVYSDCTTADVLVNILSSTAPDADKIYIDPIENIEKTNNIFIPPLNLSQAINYLDSYYYLYNYGSANLYIENNKLYLYNVLNEHTEGNILQCDVISTSATVNTEKLGLLTKDEDGNLKVTYRNLPTYIRDKKIITHATGSDVTYYSYDENFNLVTRISGNKDSFKKERYIWNSNKFKHDEDVTDINTSLNESIALTLSSVSMQYFSPLMTIRLNSTEYPKASGDYFVNEISYMFKSNDMKHYTDTVLLSAIKKI